MKVTQEQFIAHMVQSIMAYVDESEDIFPELWDKEQTMREMEIDFCLYLKNRGSCAPITVIDAVHRGLPIKD